jgi:uncharacterized LabA/DUF88 family protein
LSGHLPDTAPKVAIFIDYENVKGPERTPAHLILKAIKRDVSAFGVVALSKVYLALGRLNDPTTIPQSALYEIYRAGGEPVVVPSFVGKDGSVVKSMVDPEMICDLMESPYEKGSISVYCVASGDKDMLPAARRLHRKGMAVRLYAPDCCAAILRDEVEGYADLHSGFVELEDTLERNLAHSVGTEPILFVKTKSLSRSPPPKSLEA